MSSRAGGRRRSTGARRRAPVRLAKGDSRYCDGPLRHTNIAIGEGAVVPSTRLSLAPFKIAKTV